MIFVYILLVIAILTVVNIVVECYLREQNCIDKWLDERLYNLRCTRDIPIFSRWYIREQHNEGSGMCVGYSSIVMLWKLYRIRLIEKRGYDVSYYFEEIVSKSCLAKKSWWID